MELKPVKDLEISKEKVIPRELDSIWELVREHEKRLDQTATDAANLALEMVHDDGLLLKRLETITEVAQIQQQTIEAQTALIERNLKRLKKLEALNWRA